MKVKMKKVFANMAYLIVRMICAATITLVSIGLVLVSVGIFIWIFTTEQPVWISGPCSILGGFIWLLVFCYSESVPTMPARWENFFLRIID